jgi:tRNA nucleotidyltransferase/poly(A) polymerase
VTGVSHLRDAAWHRDGEVGRLLALLDRAGEEARVVGGAVCNTLLRLQSWVMSVVSTCVSSFRSHPTSQTFVRHIVCGQGPSADVEHKSAKFPGLGSKRIA